MILNASVVSGAGSVDVNGGGGFLTGAGVPGAGGTLVIATNTAASTAPGLSSGTNGTRLTATSDKTGRNIYFTEFPNTPFIGGMDLVGGIAHTYGVLSDPDAFQTPVGAPTYAIAAIRKVNDGVAFGADYLGHDGFVFQNLTDKPINDPKLGRITLSNLRQPLVRDYTSAYAERREIGEETVTALGAQADWVTLIPHGTHAVVGSAAGFLAGGALSNVDEPLYMISPKISAEKQGVNYLLVGSSTRVEIDVKNLNLDAATDLSLSGASGTSTASVDSVPALFSVAEGQTKTLSVDVTAQSRGVGGDIILASNDFFEPEAVASVGTGVAPAVSVSQSKTNKEIRAGQVFETSVRIRNFGDGNLSGLGTVSNLNGAFMASGDTGVGFNVASGSFSLEDGAVLEVPISISSNTSGLQTFRVEVALENGSNASNSSGNRLAGSEVKVVGPRPELSFTDTNGESRFTASGLEFPITFDLNNLTEIELRIANQETGRGRLVGLAVFAAEITGADADLFSIGGFTPGTVAAGFFEDLVIGFNGTAQETYDATLTFTTDYLAPGGAGTSGESFSFALAAIPEPSTGLACLLSAALLVFRRRRE